MSKEKEESKEVVEEGKSKKVELVVKQVVVESAEQVYDGDKPISDRELMVKIYNGIEKLKGTLL